MIVHSIKKRELFNIVGNIFKTAFGTLDESDAEHYENLINSVKNKETQSVDLIKQQSQVVQSTISNFNKSITNLENNRKIFDENFKKLANATKDLTKGYFNLSLKELIEDHFSLLNLIINEYQHEISVITNTILFAKSNQIHPMIMNVDQYIQELEKVSTFLPTSLSFTLPLNLENAYQLMQVASIEIFLKNNKLIYVISNPLIEGNQYLLYNIIPLPIPKTNNDYIFILPSIKLIAIDESKTNYFTLSSLNECQLLNENKYLCYKNEPIYSTRIRPICETELLFTSNTISKSCNFHIISNPPEIWKKLYNKNRWIYILPKYTDVTVNCKKTQENHFSLEHLTLSKTGIVELKQNCKLYTSSTTLIAETLNIQTNFDAFIPNISFGTTDCCENEKYRNINLTEELNISLSRPISLDSEHLQVASEKLDNISKLANELHSQTLLDKIYNNNYLIYTFCTVLKIFVLYLFYRIYKFVTNRNKNKQTHGCQRITKDCCQSINNCLTLNINKKNDVNDLEIDLNDIPVSIQNKPNEQSSLRRSLRIAKLKDQV